MRKLSQIQESRWTDIQKRSSGEEIRIEDDVNSMGVDRFVDYLVSKYRDKVYHMDKDHYCREYEMDIVVDPIKNIVIYGSYINDKLARIMVVFRNTGVVKLDNGVAKLIETSPDNYRWIRLYSDKLELKLEKGDVTNQTYVDVIELFLNNEIYESRWTDIQKRSSGEEIRQEDDVDIMDGEVFCDYLKSKYDIDNSQNKLKSEIFCVKTPSICFINIPLFIYNDKKDFENHASFEYYPDEDAIGFGCTSKKYCRIFLDLLSERFSDFDINKETQFFRGGITNKRVIEMIDFVIDNIKKPLIPLIVRK